uniref:Uncharacterized protein n=1 Tax=Nicotiana tabacum TaxID=4097 RepID=A0A1S3Y4W3_TOBAC
RKARTHGSKKQKQRISHAVNGKPRVLYKSLILELRIDCLTGINWTGVYLLAQGVLRNRICRRASYELGLPSLPVILVSSAFVHRVFLESFSFSYFFVYLENWPGNLMS